MDWTEHLRAWGLAHAEARKAESAAREGGNAVDSGDLRRQAQSLRDRADRLHHEVYRSLDRRGDDTPR
jgi:hypothetical protein